MSENELESVKKAKAKEALLQAAATLFSEKGYEAVSTRELAEAAGVNLGAIQYHFGSKERLFVETVQLLMRSSGCARAHFALASPPKSKDDAASALCTFISSFLEYLLCSEGPQACRLMIREIITDRNQDNEMYRTLVSSVVSEFSKPLEEMLIATLRTLTTERNQEKLQLLAQSVLGQCTVYATHRPFLEVLLNADLGDQKKIKSIAFHICTFTLQGLGCSESTIQRALANLKENV